MLKFVICCKTFLRDYSYHERVYNQHKDLVVSRYTMLTAQIIGSIVEKSKERRKEHGYGS